MAREFFDGADRLLNQEGTGDTLWGNLGDWSQAQSYPQAAEALARRLADAAGLQAGQSVLDLGFGMGEQLRLWSQAYGIRDLQGLNPSRSQTELARARSDGTGFELHCLGAEDLSQLSDWLRFDRVLALDCAYHFPQRRQLLAEIAGRLSPSGCLAWTDLYLREGHLSWPQNRAAAVCRIPSGNLQSPAAWQQELSAVGLHLTRLEDITGQVFLPFANWWQEYSQRIDIPFAQRLKYDASAALMRWAARGGRIRYGLFVAERA